MGGRRLREAKKMLKPLVACLEKHRLALPSAKGGEHSRVLMLKGGEHSRVLMLKGGEHSRVLMLSRLENCDHCQAHVDKFSEIILFCEIIGLSCFTLL